MSRLRAGRRRHAEAGIALGRAAGLVRRTGLGIAAGLWIAGGAGCAGSHTPSLACPAGTALRTAERDGWCERPDGTRHGPLWSRHRSGALATHGTAVEGRLEGTWREWHPNGRLSIEAEFRHDVLSGDFAVFGDGGTKLYAGRHDASGAMDGTWRRWWPSGALRTEWTMRHGRHEGAVRGWYESGRPRLEGAYTGGRPTGRWTWWHPDGSVKRSCTRDPAADPAHPDGCALAAEASF